MAAGGAEVLAPARRGAVVSLVAVLLAAVAAGCGGGEGELSPEAVAQAAAKTSDAGTYRATFTVSLSGIGDEPVTISGEGVFDHTKKAGRFTFDLSEVGRAAGGVPVGEVEMIFDGLVVYMNLPFLQQAGLKPWIEVDLQKIGTQEDFGDVPALQQLNQSDPSQLLAYLRAVSEDVEEVGEEEVRGVETTHYTMSVELVKVAEQAPEEEREQVRASIELIIEQTGMERLPVEVWIDGDGLVRRMKLDYPNMPIAPGQEGDVTMTTELYDFGVEVDIEPPPADEVMSFEELLELGSE